MKRLALTLLTLMPLVAAAGLPRSWARGSGGGDKAEVKTIPLESIYSTSQQKGLIRVDQGLKNKDFRNEFYTRTVRTGASNIFLVRGDSIEEAVKATWLVFVGGHPVSQPVSADLQSKSEQYWLVGYLGAAGSDPPAWLVVSAQKVGKKVRLTYTRKGSETDDTWPYFDWVPLGKLEPGTYTAELFDDNLQEAVLSRRILVAKK